MHCARVLTVLRQHHAELSDRFGVEAIAVFGSTVRGEARDDSDVDLLVQFRPSHHTLRNFFRLRDFLEQALGAQVDLTTLDALKPAIRAHVEREALYA